MRATPPREFYAGLDLSPRGGALAVLEVEGDGEVRYLLRRLRRFGSSLAFSEVARIVTVELERAPLLGATTLTVNATSIGQAVVDLFPSALTLTVGEREARDLGGLVRVVLEGGRLRIAARLPGLEAVLVALRAFTGARGQSDEPAWATALGLWGAEGRTRTRLWTGGRWVR